MMAAIRAQQCGPRKLSIAGEWEWLLAMFANTYGIRNSYAALTQLRWVMRYAVLAQAVLLWCLRFSLFKWSVLRWDAHDATHVSFVNPSSACSAMSQLAAPWSTSPDLSPPYPDCGIRL